MPERQGELAIVLHTHMPYVEGFGTWPFGEEWLWEAIATCYLPLLDLLDEGAPLTLSLTPVLCDQLEAEGVGERYLRFLGEVREETHRKDVAGLRDAGGDDLADEVERAAGDYEWAARRFEERGGDLLAAFARHVGWTSAATHAVLPLMATDAGVRLQLASGIASHRRRFGEWGGGFWLPECAYAPWLEPLLLDAGVRAACVDFTDLLGRGSPDQLTPLVTENGLALVPIDREIVELVWSDNGYPAHGIYRDYHRHTIHHHRPWNNGGDTYDFEAAKALAREHAADFVSRVGERVKDGGLCVCAIDTELLGHWWYEGLEWLRGVLDEAAAQGLAIALLDDALERHEPIPAPADIPVTTWGTPRDLSTWDAPRVGDFAWRARAGELRALAAGMAVPDRALRELLALQASDWAFMVSRGLAGDYPRERAEGHAGELEKALASIDSAPPALHNLTPDLDRAAFLAP
jgi:1,4-alpha-glucan branching enzyme